MVVTSPRSFKVMKLMTFVYVTYRTINSSIRGDGCAVMSFAFVPAAHPIQHDIQIAAQLIK